MVINLLRWGSYGLRSGLSRYGLVPSVGEFSVFREGITVNRLDLSDDESRSSIRVALVTG